MGFNHLVQLTNINKNKKKIISSEFTSNLLITTRFYKNRSIRKQGSLNSTCE